MSNENNRIAIIAVSCASAIWVYDQTKITNGINIMMILCIMFIASSFLYAMATGVLLMENKQNDTPCMRMAQWGKNFFYNFTIKYFWYILLYLLYVFTMGTFKVPFKTANIILTVMTIVFGIIAILSLFNKPSKFFESIINRICSAISRFLK